MIDHVGIVASDYPRSKAFYSEALATTASLLPRPLTA